MSIETIRNLIIQTIELLTQILTTLFHHNKVNQLIHYLCIVNINDKTTILISNNHITIISNNNHCNLTLITIIIVKIKPSIIPRTIVICSQLFKVIILTIVITFLVRILILKLSYRSIFNKIILLYRN